MPLEREWQEKTPFFPGHDDMYRLPSNLIFTLAGSGRAARMSALMAIDPCMVGGKTAFRGED